MNTAVLDQIAAERQRIEEHLWCDEAARREAAAAVPRETRVEFMRLIKKSKTIGEAKDACGLSLPVACQILNENIVSAQFFSNEVR